jgi:LacI family transcriptional regulator
MPDIKDVARHAGVSITTVSRVMNNSAHPVNPETRKRVLEAAEALNYVPNPLARALVSDESHIIGVIVGDASDPYFATIVRGISDAARERGYLTILCNTDRVPAIELDFVRLLRDYCADGIIFAGGGLTDCAHLEQLEGIVTRFQANHVPVVALGDHLANVPQVNIDNVLATKEITEYLIGMGHRRIGSIAGPTGLTTSRLRLEGYQQALAEHGLPFDPDLVVAGDFTFESGQRAALQLMARHPQPTAILGANDRDALGCLFQLKQQGFAVPEQVSVAGFDDIDITQYVYPSLTTVHVPMRDIGKMGVKQLLRAMESDEPLEQKLILPHSLVIRASTAPAAA